MMQFMSDEMIMRYAIARLSALATGMEMAMGAIKTIMDFHYFFSSGLILGGANAAILDNTLGYAIGKGNRSKGFLFSNSFLLGNERGN